jgi:hypothetical protein
LVDENYFSWGEKPCQQICRYYLVSLSGPPQIPLEGTFRAIDELLNERTDLDFTWILLSQLNHVKLYPLNIVQDLLSIPDHIKYFIYRE